MRLRKVKNANEKLMNSNYFIKEPEKYLKRWQDLFQNDHAIHLEIGTGKGQFLIEKAKENPNINFIGIEKYNSVLVRAIEKIEKLELKNIYFLCFDAKEIHTLFHKEIDTLYLNFSDPWPKERHKKRRLTSGEFLEKYEIIFKNSSHIIQKTDNINLFAFSLEEYSKFGYTLEKVSLDLKNEKDIKNTLTEYEEKFMDLGYKINYVEVIKK